MSVGCVVENTAVGETLPLTVTEERTKRFRIKVMKRIKHLGLRLMVAGSGTAVTMAGVNAQDISVNWTQIGDVIRGAGQIMPSIGSLITAVVPILLLLIVVGFVTGLFDGIIGAIQDALRVFRR